MKGLNPLTLSRFLRRMALDKVSDPMREEFRPFLRDFGELKDQLAYYSSDKYDYSGEYDHEVHFKVCNEVKNKQERLGFGLVNITKKYGLKLDKKRLFELGYKNSLETLEEVTNPPVTQKFYRWLKSKLMDTEYSESKSRFKQVKGSSDSVQSFFSNLCIEVGIGEDSLNIPTYRSVTNGGVRQSYREYMANLFLENIAQEPAEISDDVGDETAEYEEEDAGEDHKYISRKFSKGLLTFYGMRSVLASDIRGMVHQYEDDFLRGPIEETTGEKLEKFKSNLSDVEDDTLILSTDMIYRKMFSIANEIGKYAY